MLLGATTIHMLTAGTDSTTVIPETVAILMGMGAVFGTVLLLTWRAAPRTSSGRPVQSMTGAPASAAHGLTIEGSQAAGSLVGVPSSSLDRSGSLHRLRHDDFDVLVVGGGITGAGVALDAASRGLRTALVERDDFASGTSSKSSKLVHGGLRYLDQHEFRLVYEGLAERQRIIENAPHLVSILPFLVPVLHRGGAIDRRLAPFLGGALWMYDLTGGVRIGRRHRRISADDALAHMPTLDRSRLTSAYVYFDAQADDARLTLAIVRTAAAHGAAVVNDARVVGFEKHGDTVVGARIVARGDDAQRRRWRR